jgi:hypothetical protein
MGRRRRDSLKLENLRPDGCAHFKQAVDAARAPRAGKMLQCQHCGLLGPALVSRKGPPIVEPLPQQFKLETPPSEKPKIRCRFGETFDA